MERRILCQYCSDFRCISCNKHVYDKQEGIFCDGCCFWIHRKCAKIKKNECKNLCQSEDPWFCRTCNKEMLPFFNLDDKKQSYYYFKLKLEKNKLKINCLS